MFQKLAHGTIVLGEQISFWWSVFRQLHSREVCYSRDLFTVQRLIDDNFLDFKNLEKYRQEFDLVYNLTFDEYPGPSVKFYSRYQSGLIMYHSILYSRRKNSDSYSVCVQDGLLDRFYIMDKFSSSFIFKTDLFSVSSGISNRTSCSLP